MSSNIRLNRICEECNNSFVAHTTVTRFCSKGCNGKFHKRKIKLLKINASNQETQKKIEQPRKQLVEMDYLTIQDTCTLLQISRTTLWRLLKEKVINAHNLRGRKIIQRVELSKLFEEL